MMMHNNLGQISLEQTQKLIAESMKLVAQSRVAVQQAERTLQNANENRALSEDQQLYRGAKG